MTVARLSNLRSLKTIEINCTSFGDLKEGNEFILMGYLPVLLSDVKGVREGDRFILSGFEGGEKHLINTMLLTPVEFCESVDLTYDEQKRDFEEWRRLAQDVKQTGWVLDKCKESKNGA